MQKLITIIVLVFLFSNASAQVNITRAEYFFDTDPGFGNGTTISLVPSANIINDTVAVSLSTLLTGIHILYIRSRDANGKWSSTNRRLFYRSNVLTSPNITRAEYFVDIDPGFGNGTSIPITTAPNIINANFNLTISSLSSGLHNLFIRSLDGNGRWSVTGRQLFYKTGSVLSNIVAAEYFVDTDPGFGNGTTIPVTASSNISNANFNLSITSLSAGLHNIFIRSLNGIGKWSVSARQLFYKTGNSGIASNIVAAEYFIDTDPGFGNASGIVLTPSPDIINNAFPISLTSVSIGIHQLFIRSKNANGMWSVTGREIFYKSSNSAIVSNITKVEYFLDSDPGFGNGVNVPVTANTDIQNSIINIPLTNTTEGIHNFYLRSKNTAGNWSITDHLLFVKLIRGNGNITKVEYFIDSDPGFGNAVPVAINPAIDLANQLTQVNITGLTNGNHKLYVRSRTSQASSITNVYDFPISSSNASPFIAVNSTTTTTLCARDSFNIGYDVTGTYNSGNVFTAQLSDATGSFATPIVLGNILSPNSGLISCYLPAHLADGVNYHVRVISSSPVVIGGSSDTVFTIHNRPLSQTITGRNQVNGTYTWPYSVTTLSGSNFNWLINGGSLTALTTTNNANILWTQPVSTTATGGINVIETSQYGCVGDTSSQAVTIYKLRLTQTVSDIALCRGEALLVNVSGDGAFDPGNVVSAQLSDIAGSFTTPVVIGSKAFATNGINLTATIQANIPPGTALGSGYRVRVISNAPSISTADNGNNMSVNNCICSKNLSGSAPPSIDSVGMTYTPLQNISGTPTSPFYTNYPIGPTTTATVYRGDRFELSLKVSNNAAPYNIAVWVDYNNNNIFEASENVILTTRSGTVGSDWAQIPLVLATSTARLRIRVSTDPITADDCCKTLANGETEDYTISFNQVLNCRWIGRISSDWHNPLNWSCGIVPDGTKSVMIPAGTAFNCQVTNADAVINRLWIQPGATITVASNRKLTMNGSNATFTW